MTINEELAKFAKDNTRYLKLNPGESYVGYFMGAKKVPNQFKISKDPTATTIVYTFKDGEGRMLDWSRDNPQVALDMSKIKIGGAFSLTMIQKGKYVIQGLGNGQAPQTAPPPVSIAEEEMPPVDINDTNVPF
jgi:hypothetical protein